MNGNPVKQTLKSGGTVFGSEVSRLRLPEIARLYAGAGLDFVFIDMEHTAIGFETLESIIHAARASDIVPIVRVPQGEYNPIARVLDLGAQGIIVPRVDTPEHAERIVSWTRYPPHGVRGFACTPNQTDGENVDPQIFMDRSLQNTLVVVQIERRAAVEALDEMLSIDGIDVACLGYMDLSVDLGVPGQTKHPSMVGAIQRLVDVSNKHAVAPGIICPDVDTVLYWMDKGMRFVSHKADFEHLDAALKPAFERLRKAAGDIDPDTAKRMRIGNQ